MADAASCQRSEQNLEQELRRQRGALHTLRAVPPCPVLVRSRQVRADALSLLSPPTPRLHRSTVSASGAIANRRVASRTNDATVRSHADDRAPSPAPTQGKVSSGSPRRSELAGCQRQTGAEETRRHAAGVWASNACANPPERTTRTRHASKCARSPHASRRRILFFVGAPPFESAGAGGPRP